MPITLTIVEGAVFIWTAEYQAILIHLSLNLRIKFTHYLSSHFIRFFFFFTRTLVVSECEQKKKVLEGV